MRSPRPGWPTTAAREPGGMLSARSRPVPTPRPSSAGPPRGWPDEPVTSVLDRPAPPPDLTLRYGPLPEHVVDLRFPLVVPGRAAPLIVLIHGGFWRPAYDRTHLGPMGHALAAAGYMVAVPEYRRAGMAQEGWTGTFDHNEPPADQKSGIAGPHS